MAQHLVLIGTYTGGSSQGIYATRLDTETGRLEPVKAVAAAIHPSFLAVHPTRDVLYAVSEQSTLGGEDGGRLLAYRLDRDTGRLDLIGDQPTAGGSPCHLSVDRRGRHLFVTNYSGGSVAHFLLDDDGAPQPGVRILRHHGSGPNPARQEKPHPHSAWVDPTDRFVLAPDLGIDQVVIYRLDPLEDRLVPHGSTRLAPGAGPRHLSFHPGGRYAFVINELDSTVTAFAWDPNQGSLTPAETLSTLPKGYSGTNLCAHVTVHPSGRFLYGSNRGHDSIAVFAVDEGTGRLSFVGCEPTGCKTPRHFALDPLGRVLVAAGQESDRIVSFFVDSQTGRLEPTGHAVDAPTPVCILVI